MRAKHNPISMTKIRIENVILIFMQRSLSFESKNTCLFLQRCNTLEQTLRFMNVNAKRSEIPLKFCQRSGILFCTVRRMTHRRPSLSPLVVVVMNVCIIAALNWNCSTYTVLTASNITHLRNLMTSSKMNKMESKLLILVTRLFLNYISIAVCRPSYGSMYENYFSVPLFLTSES